MPPIARTAPYRNNCAAGRILPLSKPASGTSKFSTYKRSADSQAFTLIELTVVILTIAILMGLVFTAGQGVLNRSRKVQATNDATQIVTAVNAYYTEYGKYPLLDQGADKTLPGDYTQDQLMNVLRRNSFGWDDPTATT